MREGLCLKKKQEIENKKEYSLSNFDFDKILNGLGEPTTKIFLYPELRNVRYIDELLDHNGRAIMLFLHTPNSGHWISILKKGNTIEFFDSYGYKPDTQQEKIGVDKEKQKELGQDGKLLYELAKKNGYKIIYNKKQNQSKKDGVNTCGRHSLMRILFHELSLKEYNKMMREISKKHNINIDDIVTVYTSKILGK